MYCAVQNADYVFIMMLHAYLGEAGERIFSDRSINATALKITHIC